MKVLNVATSFMMLCTLFLACEQDEPSPLNSTHLNHTYLEGHLSLDVIGGTPTGSSPTPSAMDLRFRGAGHSNLFSEIILESSHTQLYGRDPSRYRIESGKFLMTVQSDEVLFGEYQGYGVVQDRNHSIFENYRIMGGTGRFQNASGNLSLQSHQLLDCSARSATVFGTIVVDEPIDISSF